jgi:imidazolonepropionase-like amidohydrolase
MRFAMLVCAGLWYAQSAPQESSFILQGGTVHTLTGSVIENGSVLVRDGKIIGVGKNLTPPEGAQVINIAGLHVYPGMIDSASMLGLNGLEESPQTSDQAEVGLIHPQLRAFTAVNADAEQIPMSRANGVTSVIVYPDGDLLPGQLSLIHLDGSTNDQMAILPAAAMHLRFPVIATMRVWEHEPKDDDEEPQTAVQYIPRPYAEAKKEHDERLRELNAFFDKARRYRRAKLAGSKGLVPDLRYEAMMPVLEGSMPVFVTAVREREIREAIAFAGKQRIKMILADAGECYKVLDLIKARKIPVVLQPTLSLPLDDDDPYDRAYTLPAELYKAGIQFAIATFSANSVRNLPYQAAAAVAFGLPQEEAYKAVSLNAAEIFGVGKRFGSIEEGKIADLIVTTGDPLEARTEVKQVFINGKPQDLETRQKQLYKKYLSRPRI